MKKVAAILLVLTCAACGGKNNPLNPSGTDNTATLHVNVDGTTCAGLGPVVISIDGTDSGTIQPGGAGLTKTVSVGVHFVGGRAVNRPSFGWTPAQIDVPRAGFTYLLPC